MKHRPTLNELSDNKIHLPCKKLIDAEHEEVKRLRLILEDINREAEAMSHFDDCEPDDDWCECPKQWLLSQTSAKQRGDK